VRSYLKKGSLQYREEEHNEHDFGETGRSEKYPCLGRKLLTKQAVIKSSGHKGGKGERLCLSSATEEDRSLALTTRAKICTRKGEWRRIIEKKRHGLTLTIRERGNHLGQMKSSRGGSQLKSASTGKNRLSSKKKGVISKRL